MSNWESSWALYLENHLYGNRYYPMTIDPLVTPVLSDAQKKVWQGVQKVGVYWGFAGMLGGFANDPDGLEVELGEPARQDQNQNQMIGVMKMQVQRCTRGHHSRTRPSAVRFKKRWRATCERRTEAS